MRELLCNSLYIFLNAFIIYGFWRQPCLTAIQIWREEIEKTSPTALFTLIKSCIQHIFLKTNNRYTIKDYFIFDIKVKKMQAYLFKDINFNYFFCWLLFLFFVWLSLISFK